jgi:hypothetical protein
VLQILVKIQEVFAMPPEQLGLRHVEFELDRSVIDPGSFDCGKIVLVFINSQNVAVKPEKAKVLFHSRMKQHLCLRVPVTIKTVFS